MKTKAILTGAIILAAIGAIAMSNKTAEPTPEPTPDEPKKDSMSFQWPDGTWHDTPYIAPTYTWADGTVHDTPSPDNVEVILTDPDTTSFNTGVVNGIGRYSRLMN